ncbi:MAG: HD domain-containing protein [Brevinematales bacterium]|nr:HD domain-containing protein [Brevinematales bacterium]
MKPVFYKFLLFFICISPLFSEYKILSNWQYVIGDISPENFKNVEWKPTTKTYFEYISKTNVYLVFKTTLPEVKAKFPILNTYHFDQYVEVFLETNKIYQFGDKHNNLTCFGRHFIELPDNYIGKNVYIKVYSAFQNVGFSRPIRYGEKSEIIKAIIIENVDEVTLSVLFILMGLALFFLAFSTESQYKSFLALGVFALMLGITTFCRTEIRYFIFGNNPYLWGSAELISLYFLSPAICYFVYLINKQEKKNIFTHIFIGLVFINLAFALIVSLLTIIEPNILLKSVDFYETLLAITLLTGVIDIVYLTFLKRNREALIMCYGIIAIVFFSSLDLLQAFQFMPRIGFMAHYGIFLFVVSMVYILRVRLYRIHNDLKVYARQLELDKIYIKKSHEELSFLTTELESTQKEVILRLCEIAEARSKETGNHILRVSQFSKVLADLICLSEKDIRLITLSSPMHDIGKLGIPDSILNKPGKLTEEEFEIIKTHTKIGYEMLNKSKKDLFVSAAIIALQHHEKYDGTGYPNKLKGNNIHIYGRIVGIADVFDSLSSDRVYKKAWELDKVLEFMTSERGKQFDPEMVDLLIKNIDTFVRIKNRFEDNFELNLGLELENL